MISLDLRYYLFLSKETGTCAKDDNIMNFHFDEARHFYIYALTQQQQQCFELL